jgi:hypothetical protein
MTWKKKTGIWLSKPNFLGHPDRDLGRRILLGDNADGRAVILLPIRFQCVGI